MDWIKDFINDLPALAAFLLGVLVAMHPCSMAAGAAAVGYMAAGAGGRRKALANGLAYALGRMVSYTALGAAAIALLRRGVEAMDLGPWLAEWGERLLGPLLMAAGACLLAAHFLHRKGHCHREAAPGRLPRGVPGSLILGALLALAFCPESALAFFGVLVPMAAASRLGYALPAMFALGTALPAVLLAWAVACGVGMAGATRKWAGRIREWTGPGLGILFILAGAACLAL